MTATLLGVGEKEWAFKTTFTAFDDDLKAPNADLVFDGLDTFARVTLVSPNTKSCFTSPDARPTEWCKNIGVCDIYYPFTTDRVLTAL